MNYNFECDNNKLLENIEILYQTFGYGIFYKNSIYHWKDTANVNFSYFREENIFDIAMKLFSDGKYKWIFVYEFKKSMIYLKNKEDAAIFKLIKE